MLTFFKSRQGDLGELFQYELTPSVSIAEGIPCKFGADGKLAALSAQTDRPQAVTAAPAVSTANGGETALVQDISWSDGIWKAFITPQLNGVVAQAGGSTSTIIVLADQNYNANDWKGGKVYIKELDLEAIISASSAATTGNPMTFTITSANKPSGGLISGGPFPATGALLPAAPDGKTIYATPLGRQVSAAKFDSATFSTISQAIGDRTGGFAQILGADLSQWRNPYVLVTFTT